MGSKLCSIKSDALSHEMKINQKKVIVEYERNQMQLVWQKNNQVLLSGYSQIYSAGPQKTLFYESGLRNSKFDTYGKFYNQGKLIYEGQFKNGLFQGWGITEQYTGQFREGKYDGFGVYQQFLDQSKDILTFYYEGYFTEGLYSGHVIRIKGTHFPLKKVQQIHSNQGMTDYLLLSIQNGNRIPTQNTAQQIYIGQFACGYMNGVGRLFKDNRQFSGLFTAGKYREKGTVVDPVLQQERKKKRSIKQSQNSKSCFAFKAS